MSDEGTWSWIDVVDPTVVDLAALQSQLGLHELAVEDARHRGQHPKVEIYPQHAFVVLRPLALNKARELEEMEVHVFVSPDYLLTLRFTPAFDLRPTIDRWQRQPELTAEGPGYGLYALVDSVADGYLAIAEEMEDLADSLEDHVFGSGWRATDDLDIQRQVLRLRRYVVRLRRRAVPLRQGLELLDAQAQLITPTLAPYYRDIGDHLIRVAELVDNVRDLMTTLLDVRMAQSANRLNEVMKKLTAWAGIILVPTLIAGIYGMNFRNMPELDWRFGYPLALGMMGISALILYRVFKRNDWL